MKSVVISPYAQLMRNGKENPKNFPYWGRVVHRLIDRGVNVIQIGSAKDVMIKYDEVPPHDHMGNFTFKRNPSFNEIVRLINESDAWISVDSFLQHLCAYHRLKRGIVIFSQSDPKIFGYTRNINMLKDRKYLREKQFWLWEQCEFNADAFVTADEVYNTLLKLLELK